MASDNLSVRKTHNLILENRNILNITGVTEVSVFDEEKITIITEIGEMNIVGYDLHINEFSHETGDLNIDGEIQSLSYTDTAKKEGGFFGRLFR